MIEAPPSAAIPMRLADSALIAARRFDATSRRLLRVCLGMALVIACLFAPLSINAATVKHQATGSIQSRSASGIVMLKQFGKHHAQWDFVLTHDTQIPEGVVKGARVTIYYHDDTNGKRIADRVKVLAVVGAKKAS
jgi:hypothetical protein